MTATAGLRERKRLAAMLRVQEVAMDLFEADGFDAVTVEQIAAAADVSPSSVYRYFGTKEQIVLWDEYDPQIEELLPGVLAGGAPLAALRDVVVGLTSAMGPEEIEQVQRRLRLVLAVPTLEAHTARQVQQMSEMVSRLLAAREDLDVDDLAVQVFGHAVVGALLGALHHWHDTGFQDSLTDVMAGCFDLLERGLQV